MSSEFVGSKSLELDIYGLTVFRCKEISHPFMNLVNTSNPLYEKTIKEIHPGLKILLELRFYYFPSKLVYTERVSQEPWGVEQDDQNSQARFHFI